VVDKIKAVKTANKNGMGDVPVEPVTITSATRLSAEEAKKVTTPAAAPAKKG
jgi:hypothetical protein